MNILFPTAGLGARFKFDGFGDTARQDLENRLNK